MNADDISPSNIIRKIKETHYSRKTLRGRRCVSGCSGDWPCAPVLAAMFLDFTLAEKEALMLQLELHLKKETHDRSKLRTG